MQDKSQDFVCTHKMGSFSTPPFLPSHVDCRLLEHQAACLVFTGLHHDAVPLQ
jgi:hypothetical protein